MTLKAQPKASHFIDGAYVEDEAGAEILCVYPATGEVIARLHAATPAIVEKAVESAKRAQKDWAKLSPQQRGRILRKAADIIRERNQELSELETLDTGKPIQETTVADPASGADAFEFWRHCASSAQRLIYPPWRRFCLYETRSTRCLPWNWRMELSAADRLLESCPSLGDRQCHDLQAIGKYATWRAKNC